MAATEAYSGYLGMAWQIGILKYLALGFQSRMTWPYERRLVSDVPNVYGEPMAWGYLGSHAAVLRGNLPLPGLPVTLSLIATGGVAGHSDITGELQGWQETCTTTCFSERTRDYGDRGGRNSRTRSESRHVTDKWQEGWERSQGEAHGTGSVSIQAGVDVGKQFTLLLLSTLEAGQVDVSKGQSELWVDARVPAHDWEVFPVVLAGGGVDILLRPVYLVLAGYYPFEWRDDVQYGPGMSAQMGFQF